ncbi:oligopeptide transport system substrate-binding protein [Naumannella cuiyingiana]|uniref:Oligopeptide transport system substrate-binding protein n=1 Tax=Naumannella cuiyingiana TaxID=1347891 RepID=A0A7Z0ILT2_9ACTN|nr:ABC transporter substrate-binding protein [Naumannella cuiyingiana]NYI71930.1 oligopeptide transport system substrate-binding protein [Naumannella cuiyingiana]
MRGRTRLLAAGAASIAAAMLVAACGSGGGTNPGGTTDGAAAGGGEYSVNSCTPENPLIAGNTAEVCGGNILDLVTAKLVHYNGETAAPENDIAESIETEDNQTFTVKIKPGYKFHDGTEIKAKNFVDAWNYTAYGPNGQQGSYFMQPIEGFKDTQCPDDECKSEPKTDKLSGLAVVDDTTFTIKTTEKVSNLPVRLGYTAFAPQPDAFFADTSEGKEEFAKKPIGAGPYQVESVDTQQTVLTKFADYTGVDPGNADKITFRIYEDIGAAYADVVAGNLDVIDQIPPDQLAGDLYKSDLPDRNQQKSTLSIGTVEISPSDEQLKNVDLRKAISMAIDREEINTTLFNGSRPALDGWGSPSLPEYQANTCGPTCEFNPTEAKRLYDAAGGYKGKLLYTTNPEGAGNRETAQAVCNQLKNNLGVDCQINMTVDFASFLTGRTNAEYTGIWRSGWQADYPSIENYLTPLYSKGSSSNYTRYDNPEFERLLADGNAAATPDEANQFYRQAEEQLAKDLPSLPMFYRAETIGWSDRVSNVNLKPLGTPDYTAVTVNG